MISILLVEDSLQKRESICMTIAEVPGCSVSQIITESDVTAARKQLQLKQFDLLILDIALPKRAGEDPDVTAGIQLLNELSERPEVYFLPHHIVGITAKEELLVPAGVRFAEDLWSVISYDVTTVDWKNLLQRRVAHIVATRRAATIAAAKGPVAPTAWSSLPSLILGGEGEQVEFKSSIRFNVLSKRIDKNLEQAVVKTIAAFLNSSGGTLIVGVSDTGEALGLDSDEFASEDKLLLHVTSLVRDRIGAGMLLYVNLSMETYCEKRVLRVDCSMAATPAYVRADRDDAFFIRSGPATSELKVREVHDYINTRFGRANTS